MNSSETMDEKSKIIALRAVMEESLTPENRHVTRTRKVVKNSARPSLADKYKHGIAHLKGSSLPKHKFLKNKGKHNPQQAEEVWANTPWFQGAQTQKAVPPTEDAKTLQGALNQPAVPQTQQSWFQGFLNQPAVPPTQDWVPQPRHSWFQGAGNQPEGPRTLDSWFQTAQTQEAVPQAQVPWFQGANSQGAAPAPQNSFFQVAQNQPDSWFQGLPKP
ncbi:uncharacterized protein LOC119557177 [Drosophila subpulchrella]|uniref:uncharacterized protein LOC119557177 n=1 Tax=Drosophila subpulchrella TaxID=1486046 RepID=UPI0018A15BF8|nr:uncharacterized protein LOC119557177 [Drosophila subpulchrella]